MFSVDEDIDLNTWNDVAVEWFRGIKSIVGVERTGIYAHSRACSWAIQDGVVGRSTTPGRRWVWQTRVWSFGETEPAAVLYQDVIDTASNPGPLVDGTRVDVNAVCSCGWSRRPGAAVRLDRRYPGPASRLPRRRQGRVHTEKGTHCGDVELLSSAF